MLYCNDEVVNGENLKKLFDKVDKAVPKWPLIIKINPDLITNDKDNNSVNRPSQVVVPLSANHSGENGSERWNYCTNRDKTKDRWVYYSTLNGAKQGSLTFINEYAITDKQKDLAYFILFLSPLRKIENETEASKLTRGVKPNTRFMYVVENKEQEAETRMKKLNERRKIENAILENLPLEKIRIVAAAMEIAGTETKGEMELRDELFQLVEFNQKRNPEKGYKLFLSLSKIDDIAKTKSIIQRAIDKGLIIMDSKGEAFLLKTKNKSTHLTGVIGARSLRESLEVYMGLNPETLDQIKMMVEEADLVTETA